MNQIIDLMVSKLAMSAVHVYCGFLSPAQVKTKTVKLVFVASKHTTLMSKDKDWLAWNKDNLSEWSNMSTRGLLRQ